MNEDQAKGLVYIRTLMRDHAAVALEKARKEFEMAQKEYDEAQEDLETAERLLGTRAPLIDPLIDLGEN